MPSAVLVGYARTSTTDQKAGLDAQLRDLKEAGCTKIFHEQVSSVSKQRAQLDAALEYVREGDTLVVTKLDRLARSISDLVVVSNILSYKRVALRILSMNIDTETPNGKLMLNIFGSVAEFERELMLERQREGIAKAKAEGKYKGRAPTARMKTMDVLRLKAEGKTGDKIAQELGIGRASVFRIIRSERLKKECDK